MDAEKKEFDVVIVGGGPAGLAAGLILGRANRSVLVIDAGQARNRSAQRVNGLLGVEGTTPSELRDRGMAQCRAVGVAIVEDVVVWAEKVEEAAPPRSQYSVRTTNGSEYCGRKILFATGTTDTLPPIPFLADCYGISVHICPYCDGWEHRGRALVALADKPAVAIALARTLRGWSENIAVVTNGAEPDPAETEAARSLCATLYAAPVDQLVQCRGQVEQIRFKDGTHVIADAIFVSCLTTQQCTIPSELGCKVRGNDEVQTTKLQRTAVKGVFLAGDADGDVQFVSVAAAEGATAAVAINKELLEEDFPLRHGTLAGGE